MDARRCSLPQLRKVQGEHGLADTFRRLSLNSSGSRVDKPAFHQPNVGRRIAKKFIQVVQPGTGKPNKPTEIRSASLGDPFSEVIIDGKVVRDSQFEAVSQIDLPRGLYSEYDRHRRQSNNDDRHSDNSKGFQSFFEQWKDSITFGRNRQPNLLPPTVYELEPPQLNKPLPPLPSCHDPYIGHVPMTAFSDSVTLAPKPSVIEYRHDIHQSEDIQIAVASEVRAGPIRSTGIQVVNMQSHTRDPDIKYADIVQVHRYKGSQVVNASTTHDNYDDRHERSIRESREYDAHPRSRPAVLTTVLPARCFEPIEEGLYEIPEDEVLDWHSPMDEMGRGKLGTSLHDAWTSSAEIDILPRNGAQNYTIAIPGWDREPRQDGSTDRLIEVEPFLNGDESSSEVRVRYFA